MDKVSKKECLHKIPGMYYYGNMVLYDTTPRWIIEPVKEFRFRENDVLIAGYPKCGTSFIQEIVYLINNNVDVEAANKIPSFMRVPYMELIASPEEEETKTVRSLEALNNMPQGKPRLMKSHFPVDFYLDQISKVDMKVVLGLRNVKDVLVSFYHFYRMNKTLGCFPGTWDEFFTMFENKQLLYGDYFDWVLPWWNASKTHSNIYPVKYEDLKTKPQDEVKKLATFLCHSLSDKINSIVRATDFKEMASKSTTNYSALAMFDFTISPFMRKGCVGDWENYFTPEQNAIIDQMITENLGESGLNFQYKI